jgi:CheY-like chemotaxis protein
MALIGLLEDNDRIAKLCATFLHLAGHQVTIYDTSFNCLRALFSYGRTQDAALSQHEIVSGNSLPVEILILDLSLPDINGIEVLYYLTTHPHTQSLPLIVCTAAINDIETARRIAPHAGIVEKPFKLETLVSAIASALKTPAAQ